VSALWVDAVSDRRRGSDHVRGVAAASWAVVFGWIVLAEE